MVKKTVLRVADFPELSVLFLFFFLVVSPVRNPVSSIRIVQIGALTPPPPFFFPSWSFFLPAACPPALLIPFPFVSLPSLFVGLFSSVLSLIVLLKPFSHVSRALLLTLSHMDIACIPIRVPFYQSPPLLSRSFPTPNCCFSSQTKKKKRCVLVIVYQK